jgi:hypothetical protein
MTSLLGLVRQWVEPALIAGGLLLLALLALLLAERAANQVRARRNERKRRGCDPVIQRIVDGQDWQTASLRSRLTRDLDFTGGELVRRATAATDDERCRLRAAAETLGLLDRWKRQLSERRWWRRASAARSLGLLGDAGAVEAMIERITDEDPEVAACAIEGLGYIADPRAVAALFEQLSTPSRRHRARVIGALQRFGAQVAPDAYAHLLRRPADASLVAELIIAVASIDAEIALTLATHVRPEVRTAGLRLLEAAEPDARAVAAVTSALQDREDLVRATAARVLGKWGRTESADALAALMNDSWPVASASAAALRRMGDAGLARLGATGRETGQASEIARQMLGRWRARSTA